jgi:peptidoglycan/LPS O-acetylase OafA/YrhL
MPTAADPATELPRDAPGRVEGIDFLRGLSILGVLLLHLKNAVPSLLEVVPQGFRTVVFWNGATGVVVFFAVSGFLITSNCLRRWGDLRRVEPLAFYRFRFARIGPCLLAILAVSAALHLLQVRGFVIQPTSLPRALFAALTFHLNWLEAKVGYLPGNWNVLWSLSVEEAFYVLFPLLCVGLKRGIVPLLVAFVVIGPFDRVANLNERIWGDESYLSGTDAIALGCLAALVAPRVPARALRVLQVLGTACLVLVMGLKTQTAQLGLYKTGLDGTLLGAGAAMLCIAFQRIGSKGLPVFAPLRWLGRASYEVYLTHMFVMLGMASFVFPGRAGVALGLCALLGWGFMRFYSEPLNARLRRHSDATLAGGG